jgi:hypothetical protein
MSAMKPFAQGYQEALADVLNTWMDNGPEAAVDYIKANLTQHVPANAKAQKLADHEFRPYTDMPEYCVAELPETGDTCNRPAEEHAPPMRLEIIHQRDPDGECQFSFYLDGQPVGVGGGGIEIDVTSLDAGRGCSFEDWAGNAVGAIKGASEAARAELYEYYADPCGIEYIEGWPEDHRVGGEWIDHIEDTPENRAWWTENVPTVRLRYLF